MALSCLNNYSKFYFCFFAANILLLGWNYDNWTYGALYVALKENLGSVSTALEDILHNLGQKGAHPT